MKSVQIDFTRVTHDGQTISVDTSYVSGGGYAYFETAAKRDGKTPRQDGPWTELGQYPTRDMALLAHFRWKELIKAYGLTSYEDDDTV